MTTTKVTELRYTRLSINRLGMWLFIISEATIFAALLWARFWLEGQGRVAELNQTIGLVITAILLISSLTAYLAEASIAENNHAGMLRYTLATLVLGVIFLAGVGIEWSEAFEFFPPERGFGRIFFVMTGMHAFHVFTGLILLAFLYLAGRRGAYSADNYWGAEAVVKYWHFVDVVWIFFYPALYLLS